MIQQVIAYSLVGGAAIYLLFKLLKRKKVKAGCDDNCNCN